MTDHSVTVTSILSQRDFGTIFNGVLNDVRHPRHGQALRVKTSTKTTLGWPSAGEQWQVRGELRLHDTWGWQIDAERAVRVVPSGKLITLFLSAHAPGVGPERAERLWRHFGMELQTVLADEANIPLIAAVIAPERPNLAPGLAAACVRSWKDMLIETRTLVWLARQGIEDVALARRICAILGPGAVERLESNPYCLVPMVDWKKLDAFGQKLLVEAGCERPSRDPRRLLGACDAVVKKHIRDGHTAGTDATLREGLAVLLRVKPHSPLVDAAVAIGVRDGAILSGEAIWRAPGCAQMEEFVVDRLRQIQASTSPVQLPAAAALKRLIAGREVSGKSLHPEQAAAVLEALQMPLACIQGGAGVGKTSVTKVICDVWEQYGGQLMLAAVGGQAALKLSRATGRMAMTLARWHMKLERRETVNLQLSEAGIGEPEKRALECELRQLPTLTARHLVIVDEASTLDLVSARSLLRLMPAGARLLLAGDFGQLPPVGFGLIYHRLVGDPGITQCLNVIHRQSEAGGIPRVAAAIRERKMPMLAAYAGIGEGVSILECHTDALEAQVHGIWEREFAMEEVVPLIVTARNDGAAGVHALNRSFHALRVDAGQLVEVKGELGEWFSPGDPCVFTHNNYSRGLVNGLLGTVIEVDPETRAVTALFDGYDEPHKIERDDLVDLQLAYAITCHRGQGGQAPCVIIPLYRTRLLDPCWLYTAVTRAQRQVVLVGSLEVLQAGLDAQPASATRMVGFKWEL